MEGHLAVLGLMFEDLFQLKLLYKAKYVFHKCLVHPPPGKVQPKGWHWKTTLVNLQTAAVTDIQYGLIVLTCHPAVESSKMGQF